MGAGLLMDNWTFQNAGEVLGEGLTGETMTEVIICPDENAFRYAGTSADLIRVQCLFQVLSNVVLAETCIVDSQATESWEELSPLHSIRPGTVVHAASFAPTRSQWLPLRKAIEETLCVCPELKLRHQENIEQFDPQTGYVPHPYLSQLIWGGAGMLARASCSRVPYALHPLRTKLVRQAGMLSRPPEALNQFQDFVDSERLKIFAHVDSDGFFGRMNLPPVAVEVINEAAGPDDLLLVALQLREKYRALRHWINELQSAFDAEDIREIGDRKKLLAGVARGIDAAVISEAPGHTKVEFGVGIPKATTTHTISMDRFWNRFGVRAQVSRLILAPAGYGAFRKLLRILGHEHSDYGIRLQNAILWQNQDHEASDISDGS